MNTKIRIYISALVMALFACQMVLACAQDPTADIDTDYVVGLKVLFDASGSYDVDGNITKYEWSVDNGQNYFEGGKKLIYTFDEGDVGTTQYIKLRVTDDDVGELTNIATCTLNLYYVYNITDTTGYNSTSRGYSLQSALDAASDGDEIWVSTGVFYPSTGSGREKTFTIADSITLYGGFTGLETSVNQRDWQKNKTILSGDIDDNGLDNGNCYHVVTFSDDGTLDGFVITQGYADGSTDSQKKGGGLYSNGYCPTLKNCIIENNYAYEYGGGLAYLDYSSGNPQITNCIFKNNENVLDDDSYGGGAYFYQCSPHIVNSCFEGNQTYWDGSSVCVEENGNLNDDPAKFVNCLFVNMNPDHTYPGLVYILNADANIYNSTFLAYVQAGVVIKEAGSSKTHTLVIKNSVFWDFDDSWLEDGGDTSVSSNNILENEDPKFVNEDLLEGLDGRYFTADDGLCVRMDSSCIDADVAGNSYLPADIADIDEDTNTAEDLPLDIAGRTRIMDGNHEDDDPGAPVVYDTVDIGAYEMPKVWYVDTDAGSEGDGEEWTTAYQYLQDALDNASDGDEIWVAVGTYYPDDDEYGDHAEGDQNEKFQPAAGVEVYGGFTGYNADEETARADRDWVNNKTTLSGDIDENGDSGDSETVVCIPNTNSKIDGFTIKDGYGGSRGGGVCIRLSRDKTGECLSNCVIANNQSEKGAGLYVRCVESALVENCYFYNNHTTYDGGAVYIDNDSKFDIKNCVFAQNQAKGYGGAVYSDESDYDLINCTFYDNKSNSDNSGGQTGGAIYNYSCDPNIINSIFRADTAYETANEIADSSDAFSNIMFCDIQGATPCSQLGIINSDPEFISNDPDGTDGDFGTVDDGLQLSVDDSSPCIDKADGDLAPMKDIMYTPRVDLAGFSGGIGIPDYADIGAYEVELYRIVMICIIDEASNYSSSGFNTDVAEFDSLLSENSDYLVVKAGCWVPTDKEPPSIDPVIIGDTPDNISVVTCGRDEDETVDWTDYRDMFLDLAEGMYPDYVLISKDASGSASGDFSQEDINDFIDWIESTYSGVTVHDDGEGFTGELWVEEMIRHINMYYLEAVQ